MARPIGSCHSDYATCDKTYDVRNSCSMPSAIPCHW